MSLRNSGKRPEKPPGKPPGKKPPTMSGAIQGEPPSSSKHLPTELWLAVAREASMSSLLALSRTNHAMTYIARDEAKKRVHTVHKAISRIRELLPAFLCASQMYAVESTSWVNQHVDWTNSPTAILFPTYSAASFFILPPLAGGVGNSPQELDNAVIELRKLCEEVIRLAFLPDPTEPWMLTRRDFASMMGIPGSIFSVGWAIELLAYVRSLKSLVFLDETFLRPDLTVSEKARAIFDCSSSLSMEHANTEHGKITYAAASLLTAPAYAETARHLDIGQRLFQTILPSSIASLRSLCSKC